MLFTGGYDFEIGASPDIYDDILEYEPEEDVILSVGHMLLVRCWHAVSVVRTLRGGKLEVTLPFYSLILGVIQGILTMKLCLQRYK